MNESKNKVTIQSLICAGGALFGVFFLGWSVPTWDRGSRQNQEEDARTFGGSKQIELWNAAIENCCLWAPPPERRTFEPIQPVEGQ